FAVMGLGHLGIGVELRDQAVVGEGLPQAVPGVERHHEQQQHDGHVVRRAQDGPELMQIHCFNPSNCEELRPQAGVGKLKHAPPMHAKLVAGLGHALACRALISSPGYFLTYSQTFLGSLISLSSIMGAGPEMPPSLRTRQKCTIMNRLAMIGMATQCQMYARRSALESTMEPPSRPKRTSLNAVMPICGPNGPSCA